MLTQNMKKTKISKFTIIAIIIQFIFSSIPASAYESLDNLRPQAGMQRDGGDALKAALAKLVLAKAGPFVRISPEGTAIGGETAKERGQKVSGSATLSQLQKLGIDVAFGGHSDTRNKYVTDTSNKIKPGLKFAVNQFLKGLSIEDESHFELALVEALNEASKIYSEENWIDLGVIAEVQPYVITAAKIDLEIVLKEAKSKGKTLNYREALIDSFANFQAREIASLSYDRRLNHRIHGQQKEGFKTITLCVGSETKNLPVEAEIQAVYRQLEIDLENVTAEQLQKIEFLLAFEPSGKIGTGTAAEADYIRQVHQAIYDWLEAKYGQEIMKSIWGDKFFLLYGASVDGKNIDGIMAVKSTRQDMAGKALVHGVLFASSGKKAPGFLAVAKGVERAGGGICFLNLKSFDADEKTPIAEFMGEIYAAISRGEIDPLKTKLFIADHDINLRDWKKALDYEHSEFVRAHTKKAADVIEISGLDTLTPVIAAKGINQAIVALDWNTPLTEENEKGVVKDNEKIINALDTIRWFKESKLQYAYGLSHLGRAGLSLKPIIDEARKVFKNEGLDIEIVLLPENLAEAKKVIDAKKSETAGTGKKVWFMLENIRKYAGEQSKEPSVREQFEKEIIALTGAKIENLVYLFEAFEKSHRAEEASIEMGFLLFPRQHYAAGVYSVETAKVVLQFLSRITGRFSVVAGGKKFDKLKNVADLGKLVGKTEGLLFILGALADPLLVNEGKNVGKSLMPVKEEDLKGVKDGDKKLKENVRDNKLKFSLPVDFIVKDGKKVKELLEGDDVQVDIGPKTIKMIVDHINSLVAGDGLLLNGGAGVFDADWGSAEGTVAIITAANEAAKRGVAVLFGGGDMVNAIKVWEEKTGLQLDDSVLASTAGGALFVGTAKGIGGGLIPLRAAMEFKGETTERLLNIYAAINKALPGAMVLPGARTVYKDTSVNGADDTREPALDLSKGQDGQHILEIPDGRRSDALKNFYETTFLPVVVTAEDVEALMGAEDKAELLKAKNEKEVSAFAQKLLRQALVDNGIPVQDWQERSHVLDPGKLGEAGVDVSSIIAIRTLNNDLLVWVPMVVKRGEQEAYVVLAQKINKEIEQKQAKTSEVSFTLPQDIKITDHKSASEAFKTYNALFFDVLQKGDLARVNVLINIVNNLDPQAMVDPAAGGIELNKALGLFTSNKDTDAKAKAPGFGQNLERFRGGLYSVGVFSSRLYHLVAPNYDAQGKVSVVVKNKELQDAVIAFYARMDRHLLATGIKYFNDARVFESLRVEVGDYAQRLNKAIKESDALELSQSSAEGLINHLTDKGITLSMQEKNNIQGFLQQVGGTGLFDVLQLAPLLRVDTFKQAFRHVKLDYARKVLPSDMPFEAYDGSGRIARTQFAQRAAADINANEKGYVGRYMVASQEIKGKTAAEKSAAAVQKVKEMLTDRQIEDAGIIVQVGEETIFLTNLINSGRMTFQAGEKVLAAQLDFQDPDQIPSAYPVHIMLDGLLKGVAYCVDIAQFNSGLKTALQQRQRALDNIPRPFIVRGENDEEIFFGLRVDATPGGVEMGDQELEAAAKDFKVKVGGDTLWKLFAKFNLPEPKGAKLTAADELARVTQIYNQVRDTRMPPEGGKEIVYAKAQIAAKLVLPGFGSLGRHIGWSVPFIGMAPVTLKYPGSCSTNGASHVESALVALAGNAEVVGPTFHMNTSSDNVATKNPFGGTALKSTGAAQGVGLLLAFEEGSQNFFTAIRTPVGLVKGKADIVGGSMFDLLVKLPNNIPDDLIIRYLSRIADEFPQDLKLFSSKDGKYTWKDMIAGQKTGSILFSDFIERVGPGIYRLKVGYDNEMSFGKKENEMHAGIYLDALRNRQTAQATILLSEALVNTEPKSVASDSVLVKADGGSASEVSAAIQTLYKAGGGNILDVYFSDVDSENLNGKLSIVTPEWLKLGGISAVRGLSRLGARVGVYADKGLAENIQALIAAENIQVSDDLKVLSEGFAPADIIVLTAPGESLAVADGIRQISTGVPNLDIAKSIKELRPGSLTVSEAFKNFLAKMVDDKVIKLSNAAREQLLAELEQGQLAFTENDVKVTDRIATDANVQKARELIRKFI